MIARTSGALVKSGINNTALSIEYGDDPANIEMTKKVIGSVAPMFNLRVIQAVKTGPGPKLVSSLKKDGSTGLWSIACIRKGEILFKTGVKVNLSDKNRTKAPGAGKL